MVQHMDNQIWTDRAVHTPSTRPTTEAAYVRIYTETDNKMIFACKGARVLRGWRALSQAVAGPDRYRCKPAAEGYWSKQAFSSHQAQP